MPNTAWGAPGRLRQGRLQTGPYAADSAPASRGWAGRHCQSCACCRFLTAPSELYVCGSWGSVPPLAGSELGQVPALLMQHTSVVGGARLLAWSCTDKKAVFSIRSEAPIFSQGSCLRARSDSLPNLAVVGFYSQLGQFLSWRPRSHISAAVLCQHSKLKPYRCESKNKLLKLLYGLGISSVFTRRLGRGVKMSGRTMRRWLLSAGLTESRQSTQPFGVRGGHVDGFRSSFACLFVPGCSDVKTCSVITKVTCLEHSMHHMSEQHNSVTCRIHCRGQTRERKPVFLGLVKAASLLPHYCMCGEAEQQVFAAAQG